LDKSEFIKECSVELVDKYRKKLTREEYIEYAYEKYVEKVKPYYQLISSWRIGEGDDRSNLNELRIALSLPYTLFEIYKGLTEFREITDLDKNIMSFKAQMDLLEAIEFYKREGKRNAKLIEMQLLRYDKEYKKKDNGGDDSSVPTSINIEFKNGSKK